MKTFSLVSVLCLITATACSSPKVEDASPTEPPAPAEEKQATAPASLPDPAPAEAAEVTAFITQFVASRAAEDGTYDIPPQDSHDVKGTMGDFHTVHQQGPSTYFVCVDFEDGDELYDVDFFVERTDAGLSLADHYLHKVNGEDVTK